MAEYGLCMHVLLVTVSDNCQHHLCSVPRILKRSLISM